VILRGIKLASMHVMVCNIAFYVFSHFFADFDNYVIVNIMNKRQFLNVYFNAVTLTLVLKSCRTLFVKPCCATLSSVCAVCYMTTMLNYDRL